MGGHIQDILCTWRLPWLPVEQPWSALAGPFLTLLEQMGTEVIPLPFKGHHLQSCRQVLVSQSVRWLESPDH